MKRKLIWPILLSAALAALGYVVEIIISIMVLAVGAFIIYKLLNVISIVLPPNSVQQTNSVSEAFYYDHGPGQSSMAGTPARLASEPSGAITFPVQYGVSSSNGLPWICGGTNLTIPNLTNSETFGVLLTLEDDTNFVDIVFQVGGNLYASETDVNAGTTTNWPLSVVVESSGDLQKWTPLFTNSACVLDSVNGFTDTNAPSDHNFYRVNYQ